MELAVRHQTIYRYPKPASQVALLLRLRPTLCDGQRPGAWQVTVNDAPVEAFPLNAYGDGEAFVRVPGPVEGLVIVAAGVVATQDRAGVVAWLLREVPLRVFLRETGLTRPDAAITALADSVRIETGIGKPRMLAQQRVKLRLDRADRNEVAAGAFINAVEMRATVEEIAFASLYPAADGRHVEEHRHQRRRAIAHRGKQSK